jgi:hypothetical protein
MIVFYYTARRGREREREAGRSRKMKTTLETNHNLN